jgi:GTP-binding protein
VPELFRTIDLVRDSYNKRVGTGELNRFFESVLETHPPPTKGGKAPRLYYVTQAETSPPAFVAITNAPDSIHFSYRRFVVNQLRKHFGFEGVPVKIFYKAKRQREMTVAPERKVPGHNAKREMKKAKRAKSED